VEIKASKTQAKILASIMSFLVFAIVGCIVWVFLGPVTVFPLGQMIAELWKPILLFGIPAALLGFWFPKAMNKVLSAITFFWS
jgi:hypothetical protein